MPIPLTPPILPMPIASGGDGGGGADGGDGGGGFPGTIAGAVDASSFYVP